MSQAEGVDAGAWDDLTSHTFHSSRHSGFQSLADGDVPSSSNPFNDAGLHRSALQMLKSPARGVTMSYDMPTPQRLRPRLPRPQGYPDGGGPFPASGLLANTWSYHTAYHSVGGHDQSQASNSFVGPSEGVPSSYYNAIASSSADLAPPAATSTAEDVETLLFRNIQSSDTSKVLDCLQLKSLLGVGSMGTVYNASLLGQRVVLKVIEHGTGLLKREKERGRLAKLEAVVCKLMVHPNIVTTYAFHTGLVPIAKLSVAGRGGPRLAGEKMVTLLVQEYCSKGTLRDALKERSLGSRASGLSYCKVCAMLGAQVAYGLQHAHSVGVVHGDLKAENVLLQSVPQDQRFDDGLDVRAKLGDLGIASVFPADQAEQGTTAMHGTVSHMPPEALTEPNVISTKTDIWSFGMVMWEMWTGELPYAGMTPQRVIREVQEHRLPEWPDNTPPVWKSLAAKCWSVDPAARPTTFQLTKALDDITAVLSKVDVATAASAGGGAAKSLESATDASVVDELDELALELALMEDESASRSNRGASDEQHQHTGPGKRPADPGAPPKDEPFQLPAKPPEHDPVAALLWHMLQEPQIHEALEVEVGPHRRVWVSTLPFLNLDSLGLSGPRKQATSPPLSQSDQL